MKIRIDNPVILLPYVLPFSFLGPSGGILSLTSIVLFLSIFKAKFLSKQLLYLLVTLLVLSIGLIVNAASSSHFAKYIYFSLLFMVTILIGNQEISDATKVKLYNALGNVAIACSVIAIIEFIIINIANFSGQLVIYDHVAGFYRARLLFPEPSILAVFLSLTIVMMTSCIHHSTMPYRNRLKQNLIIAIAICTTLSAAALIIIFVYLCYLAVTFQFKIKNFILISILALIVVSIFHKPVYEIYEKMLLVVQYARFGIENEASSVGIRLTGALSMVQFFERSDIQTLLIGFGFLNYVDYLMLLNSNSTVESIRDGEVTNGLSVFLHSFGVIGVMLLSLNIFQTPKRYKNKFPILLVIMCVFFLYGNVVNPFIYAILTLWLLMSRKTQIDKSFNSYSGIK